MSTSHTRTELVARICAAALACLPAACAETAAPSEPPRAPLAPATQGVSRYLPLPDDTVYTYETYSESTGDTGVMMLVVSRPRPGLAELDVAGKIQRVEILADGVRHIAGGYLLQAPHTAGQRFRGAFGAVVVTGVDVSIQVPAGDFSGCVTTVEESRSAAASRRVTSVYCPDVGLVSLEAEAADDRELLAESYRLKAFAPRVDVTDSP